MATSTADETAAEVASTADEAVAKSATTADKAVAKGASSADEAVTEGARDGLDGGRDGRRAAAACRGCSRCAPGSDSDAAPRRVSADCVFDQAPRRKHLRSVSCVRHVLLRTHTGAFGLLSFIVVSLFLASPLPYPTLRRYSTCCRTSQLGARVCASV